MKLKCLVSCLLAIVICSLLSKSALATSDPVPTNADVLGASPIALSTYCPSTGNTTITTCNDHIYDNGGPSAAYGASQDGYVVVYPATAGYKVQLTGTYYTEANYDYIVYLQWCRHRRYIVIFRICIGVNINWNYYINIC